MNIVLRIAVVMLLISSMSMSARDRSTARSMVVTRYGIVATSHVQASVAGAKILEWDRTQGRVALRVAESLG